MDRWAPPGGPGREAGPAFRWEYGLPRLAGWDMTRGARETGGSYIRRIAALPLPLERLARSL